MINIIKLLSATVLLSVGMHAENCVQNLIDSGEINYCFAENGELHLACKNLQSLKGLENVPNAAFITFIDLSNNKISDIKTDSFMHFPNLMQLCLNNNQINDISGLVCPENLRELHITHNKLRMLDFNQFISFPMLYVMNAGFNEIEQIVPADGLLPHLEILFLNNNKIKELSSYMFTCCPDLQALYLQDNAINIVCDDCFNGLFKLRLLYLYNNMITTINSNIFRSLKNLHTLYLRNNAIKVLEKGWDQDLHNLQLLDISDNKCENIVIKKDGVVTQNNAKYSSSIKVGESKSEIERFLSVVRKEIYQDILVDGKVIKEGVKDCEIRYPNIKKILDNYKRPFTVLDIGASEGYFSLRIAAEYDCTCVMIEGDKTLLLPHICQLNKRLDNVVVLEKFITPQDLKELGECEHFDLVLAFNVIHQLKDDWKDGIDYLLTLGDNMLIETPPPGCRTAANGYTLPLIEEYLSQNKHGKIVAQVPRYGRPGLPSPEQKYSNVYLFQMNKNVLLKPTWKSPNVRFYPVNSTFEEKIIYKPRIDKTIDWKKGINLWTFKNMNGVYPSKDVIRQEIKRLSGFAHSDFVPWNMIIQGASLDLIDWDDNNFPSNNHNFDMCWSQLNFRLFTTRDHLR